MSESVADVFLIRNRVVACVQTTFLDTPHPEVHGHSRLVEDLGMDSLHLIELALALETEFDCEIADEEFEQLRTVDEIVSFLARRSP